MSERSAQGRCHWGNCGDYPIPGSGYCGFHRARRAWLYANRQAEKRQAEYAARKERGVCARRGCNESPSETSVLCQRHVEQQRGYTHVWQATPGGASVHACKQKVWRQKMRDKGLCIICGKPAVPSMRKCQACRDRVNNHRLQQRIAAGKLLKKCSQCRAYGHNILNCPQQTEIANATAEPDSGREAKVSEELHVIRRVNC